MVRPISIVKINGISFLLLSLFSINTAYADSHDKIAGCYYTEQKGAWMDSDFITTNVVLIQQQGKDLLVRAEFNGHHVCRIYESGTVKPILMKKSGDGYIYKSEDAELGIKCELQLVASASGYEIRDVGYQCSRLWECGVSAGVDYKAEYSTKEKTGKRCDEYLSKVN